LSQNIGSSCPTRSFGRARSARTVCLYRATRRIFLPGSRECDFLIDGNGEMLRYIGRDNAQRVTLLLDSRISNIRRFSQSQSQITRTMHHALDAQSRAVIAVEDQMFLMAAPRANIADRAVQERKSGSGARFPGFPPNVRCWWQRRANTAGLVPNPPLDRTKRRNVPSPRGTTRNAERADSSAAVFPHAFGNVLQIRCGPVSVRPAHCLEQHFLKRLDAAAELAWF
jgi:hypothetical protein